MKGIILAAGRGSRMGDLTSNLPKCRTVIFGKELIQWQLDALTNAGVEEISIVRGYLNKTFEFKVNYFDNKRWADTNMVSTLISANKWLKAETNIISYADIVYSKSSISTLMAFEQDIVITYDPNWQKLWSMRFKNPLDDAETFKIQDNLITEIGNKAFNIDEIEGQFMGLLKFTSKGWSEISQYLNRFDQKQIDSMDMTMLLQGLINSKINVYGVPISDKWMEVDTESDLRIYEKEYSRYFKNIS